MRALIAILVAFTLFIGYGVWRQRERAAARAERAAYVQDSVRHAEALARVQEERQQAAIERAERERLRKQQYEQARMEARLARTSPAAAEPTLLQRVQRPATRVYAPNSAPTNRVP
jgi:hypothetical protein